MEPNRELIDDLYRQKVLRARRMTLEQKLLAGPRLFDLACQMMAAGIRDAFPDADDAQVRQMVRKRLAIARRLEDRA